MVPCVVYPVEFNMCFRCNTSSSKVRLLTLQIHLLKGVHLYRFFVVKEVAVVWCLQGAKLSDMYPPARPLLYTVFYPTLLLC